MDYKTLISWIGNGITILAGAVSENPVAQWILFGLGIFSSLISISMSIMKVFVKWKEIAQDGEITEEEAKAFSDTLDKASKEVEETAKKADNSSKEK